MKTSMRLLTFGLAVFAPLAGATEYALQFTPNAGYKGLIVAGYRFVNNGTQVEGNCSYYLVTSSGGSGKGGGSHGTVTKPYLQTCRWDLGGALLPGYPKAGAPVIPIPISVSGSLVIFDRNAAGDTTGTDLKLPERGFVTTPGSHYTWLTPQTSGVVHQMKYSLTITLKSDGDLPLDILSVTPTSAHLGDLPYTTNCTADPIEPGKLCTIAVTYDTTKVPATTSQVQDTLSVDVVSNALSGHDFIQAFTILMPREL
jgi:hypothetical protein